MSSVSWRGTGLQPLLESPRRPVADGYNSPPNLSSDESDGEHEGTGAAASRGERDDRTDAELAPLGAADRSGEAGQHHPLAHDRAFYDAMRPLRLILRVLAMWRPPGSSFFERRVYPFLVWILILVVPSVRHFYREDGSGIQKTNLNFLLAESLYILALAKAQRYFSRNHFVSVTATTMSSEEDPFTPALEEPERVQRDVAKLEVFKRLLRSFYAYFAAQLVLAALLFCVVLLMRQASHLSVVAQVPLETFATLASVVSTMQYAVLCLVYRLVLQLHRLDVMRHLTLYRVRRSQAEQLAGLSPAGSDGQLQDNQECCNTVLQRFRSASTANSKYSLQQRPFHFALSQAKSEQSSQALGMLPYLSTFGPQSCWTVRDCEALRACVARFVSDWVRISSAVTQSSHKFRLFLMVAFAFSVFGSIFSIYVMLDTMRGGVNTAAFFMDAAVALHNVFNTVFALIVMSSAARVAHTADKAELVAAEFYCACAMGDLQFPAQPQVQQALLDLRSRAAALVALHRSRRVYLSVYGLAINRSVAFGFLSPTVALLLFMIQRQLLS